MWVSADLSFSIFQLFLVKFACLKLSSLINENKTTADEINDSQQIEQNEMKCEAKKNKLKKWTYWSC